MEDIEKKINYFILLVPAFVSIILPLMFEEYLFLIFPGLILGWLMPVYVGYWRGSIKMESTLEKIRGLTYFCNGLLAYVFLALLVTVILPFSIETPFDEITLFIIIFGMIPLILWPKIKSGMLELIEEKALNKAEEALSETMKASESLTLSLYGFTVLIYALQTYRESGLASLAGIITILLIVVASVILFWLFWNKEMKARKISNHIN